MGLLLLLLLLQLLLGLLQLLLLFLLLLLLLLMLLKQLERCDAHKRRQLSESKTDRRQAAPSHHSEANTPEMQQQQTPRETRC